MSTAASSTTTSGSTGCGGSGGGTGGATTGRSGWTVRFCGSAADSAVVSSAVIGDFGLPTTSGTPVLTERGTSRE
jgi:hypothetical protein